MNEYNQRLGGGPVPPPGSATGAPAWTGDLSSAMPARPSRAHDQGEMHFSSAPAFPGVASPTSVGPSLTTSRGPPPGLDQLDEDLSTAELNLLIKFLNSMGDLPKVEIGDVNARGERLMLWRVAMEEQLKTTRRVVVDWWHWCNKLANQLYQQWLKTPVLQRRHFSA